MKIWVWYTTALLCYVGPLTAQEKTTPPARSIKLEEVEITTPRKSTPGTGTSATLTSKDLEQTRGRTLAEALTNIAGVSTLQTGATIAKPVIQGLHSTRILILNNGIRQEGQQWGMEHAPEIDPFVASRITVIKGAEGVRYGPEAIGGVVLVEPAALSKIPDITGELYLTVATNGRAAGWRPEQTARLCVAPPGHWQSLWKYTCCRLLSGKHRYPRKQLLRCPRLHKESTINRTLPESFPKRDRHFQWFAYWQHRRSARPHRQWQAI
jgi:hypothetical protein